MADVATSTPTPVGKGEKQQQSAKDVRPTKPDEEAFKKNLDAAQAEHKKAREELLAIKEKVDLAQSGSSKNPKVQQLRDELSQIRAAQSSKKSSKTKLDEQIRTLDASIKNKIKEQQAARSKAPYKSVAELDAAVKRLQEKVDGAQLKIVDERRTLQEISNLTKQRRNFGAFEEQQKEIDAEKERLNGLRDQKKDPEVQELSTKYDEVNRQLGEIKSEQDEAYKNLNSLRDKRNELYQKQQEKWELIQKLKTEHYAAKDAFRDWDKKNKAAREAKYKKEKEEQKKAEQLEKAREILEEASLPAFRDEIITCESLIGFFDPSSAEAARKAKQETAPRALAAQATRTVDDSSQKKGKVLVKKEEDYFIGGGGKKKGKKVGNARSAPAPAAAAAEKTEESEPAPPDAPAVGKFNLNIGILEQLGSIGVQTPASREDVPKTLEALREKLGYYKENQEKITKENIAKAEKKIKDLEAEENGTAPAAEEKNGDTNGDAVASEEEEKKEEETEAAETEDKE